MDFSVIKKLTIGGIELKQLFINGIQVWKAISYKNWVKYSTTNDGKTIYNNGLGYKNNTRLNSSAAETGQSGYVTFGYIPAKPGDIVRVKGITWDSSTQTGCYFWYFDASFTKQKYLRPTSGTTDIEWSNEGNGVTKFKISTSGQVAAAGVCEYIRFSAYGSGENVIITVNEEIT